jgi:hypothetical protein
MKPPVDGSCRAAFSCAGLRNPDPSNLAAYCTAETGYRVGLPLGAYYGVCPEGDRGAFFGPAARARAIRANPPQALPYFDAWSRRKSSCSPLILPMRERQREQLRQVEQMTLHIVNDPASYSAAARARASGEMTSGG